MADFYLCDTAGTRFTDESGEMLGNYCAIGHDCPVCGGTACRGRTLAWLALECAAKGAAVYPCMSCGAEIRFPRSAFVPECLDRISQHPQPNAFLRVLTAAEVLVPGWAGTVTATAAEAAGTQAAPVEEVSGALESPDALGSADDLLEPTALPEPSLLAEDTAPGSSDIASATLDLSVLEEPPAVIPPAEPAKAEPGETKAAGAVPQAPEIDWLGIEESITELSDQPVVEPPAPEPAAAVEAEPSPLADLPEFDALEFADMEPQTSAASATEPEPEPEPVAPPPPAPPKPVWDGRGSCPGCGLAGASRNAQALDCPACGVHFWVRLDSLNRNEDSAVSCPRCAEKIVVPLGAWCDTCGRGLKPQQVLKTLLRAAGKSGATQPGTPEGAAKRPRGGGFRWR